MELEVDPPLPQGEREALIQTLGRAGLGHDGSPPAYESAWRRAALRMAVEGEPDETPYARSPRSTLGATRA